MITGGKIIKQFTVLFFTATLLFAESHREIKKTFKVSNQKLIEIKSVSDVNVKIKSWDNDEIYFNLTINASSSEDDFADDYVKKFDIDKWESNSNLVIEFMESKKIYEGWSFWDLFRGKIYYKFSKSIRGEIFIPTSCALKADFRYGEIKMMNLNEEINLPGKGNKLYFSDCAKISNIENDYGETVIKNSGGNLILNCKSGDIDIQYFQGEAEIFADYGDIKISNITGKLNIDTKSANVIISDVTSDLKMSADYSKVTLNNIGGFSDLKNVSGSFLLSNVKGFYINSPYSDIIIKGAVDKDFKGTKIQNQSGKINLYDITGNIIIDDSYSDIWLKTIKGNVSLNSRSSKIEAEKVNGNWNSDTEYSEVYIDEIYADEITVSNRSGIVSVDAFKIPRLVKIDNEYGDAKVKIPKGFGGEISLEAPYGNIETDFGLSVKTHGSSSSASGRVGNGNGKIVIETRSSNITLFGKN